MTRQSLLLAILILVLPAGLAAQVWTDPFNYGGTVLGTWVEYGGDWTGWAGMAKSEEKWLDAQWLVQPTRSFQECVLQCVVKANSASTIKSQAGGLSLRVADPANNVDMVTATLEDRAGNGLFNGVSIKERRTGGGGIRTLASKVLSPAVTQATLRFLGRGSDLVALVDTDGDGVWDYRLRGGAIQVTPKVAPIAILGSRGVLVDDLKLYDAVVYETEWGLRRPAGAGFLLPDPGPARPRVPGGLLLPELGYPGGRAVARFRSGPTTCSWSRSPTVCQGSSRFSGTLDASGDATLTIKIPNVAVLSGMVFYLAFITYDATGILEISQDMRTTVVSCTNQTGRPGRVHPSSLCVTRTRSPDVLICGISSARA